MIGDRSGRWHCFKMFWKRLGLDVGKFRFENKSLWGVEQAQQ